MSAKRTMGKYTKRNPAFLPNDTQIRTSDKRFTKPGYSRSSGIYSRFRRSGELKYSDGQLDRAAIPIAGLVTASMMIITEGTGPRERIGRKVTIKQIQWRWNLILPSRDKQTNASAGDIVRLIIFQDKQTNGAAAVTGDLLTNASYLSFKNLENSSRFDFLYDTTVDLNYLTLASETSDTVSQSAVNVSHNFYKTCKIPIEYDGVSGAIDTVRSNNIGVLMISANGIANMASEVRIRYSDK